MNQEWSKLLNEAYIHTLIGENLVRIRERVGSILFVIGLAAHRANIHNNETKAIHEACRALFDLVDATAITDHQRSSIEAGLLATVALKPMLSESYLIQASQHLTALLRRSGVIWQDFEEFVS